MDPLLQEINRLLEGQDRNDAIAARTLIALATAKTTDQRQLATFQALLATAARFSGQPLTDEEFAAIQKSVTRHGTLAQIVRLECEAYRRHNDPSKILEVDKMLEDLAARAAAMGASEDDVREARNLLASLRGDWYNDYYAGE
ncbi:MAG TPA: hypothetical protein VLG40_00245 [Candidatus Saccharimonas sp.]|nr:hypothetical protein [Candidatus Saccharimonas sp.]